MGLNKAWHMKLRWFNFALSHMNSEATLPLPLRLFEIYLWFITTNKILRNGELK